MNFKNILLYLGCVILSICVSIITYISLGGNFNYQNNNFNTPKIKKSLFKTNELVCTKTTTDEDGLKNEETITITYKGNYIKKVSDTILEEVEPEYLEFTLEILKLFEKSFNKIEGFNFSIDKANENTIKQIISVDYENLDINTYQDVIQKLSEENNDTSNDEKYFYNNIASNKLLLDDFKKENLTEFECK